MRKKIEKALKYFKEEKTNFDETVNLLVLCGVGNWFKGVNETPIEDRNGFSRFVLVKNENGLYKVDRYDYIENKWMISAWDKNKTKWTELPL